ncbi:hypothetical protein C8Q72DRAFT_824223 [Fomitopsis betulina]|nr:hypothetical protein C8Q72DRAFT_824223 [Fomitopsis betulina]
MRVSTVVALTAAIASVAPALAYTCVKPRDFDQIVSRAYVDGQGTVHKETTVKKGRKGCGNAARSLDDVELVSRAYQVGGVTHWAPGVVPKGRRKGNGDGAAKPRSLDDLELYSRSDKKVSWAADVKGGESDDERQVPKPKKKRKEHPTRSFNDDVDLYSRSLYDYYYLD